MTFREALCAALFSTLCGVSSIGCTGTQHADGSADAVDIVGVDSTLDAIPSDIGTDTNAEASAACATDNDCSDHVYCNGSERCMPGASSADARGCVAASPANPCTSGQTCNEAMQRCESACDTMADADGDGHRSMACGGDDCDDADRNRFPGNPEVCDAANHDEDCDYNTFGFRDADSDGFADANCCNVDMGTRHCGDDCNDMSTRIHPSLPETCDGLDNDCNMMIDDGVQRTFHPDMDHDGYGDASGTAMMGCNPPAGYVEMVGDCNDMAMNIHPGATEVCDSAMVDENCSGAANEGCSCTGTATMSCPGALGACAAGVQNCTGGMWSACTITAHAETCNRIDDDCDGVVDNGVTIACYPDNDNDTYAVAGAASVQVCSVGGRTGVGGCPSGMTNRPPTASSSDCDDTQPAASPVAMEVCNGIDDNCNGSVDEGVTHAFYPDVDLDSYGDASASPTLACSAPTGYVQNNSDCDDHQSAVHPGTTEICDTGLIDENCNGTHNEGCACTGSATMPCPGAQGACAAGVQMCVSGMWSACSVMPTPESCNSIDDDCNGSVDDGVTVFCYADNDNDTYAAAGATAAQRCPVAGRDAVGGCPSGSTNRIPVVAATDCNDTLPSVNPAAAETCNMVDDNCNGVVDEGVTRAYYADTDGDSFGDASGTPALACSVPAGYVANNADCSDTNSAVHPGAIEVCDTAMLDENCNGTRNEGCACTGTSSVPCPGAQGVCTMGTQTCLSGQWSACSVQPTTESCNGRDDDCNGVTDDNLTITCYVDSDNDTYAPSTATPSQRCPDGSRVAWGSCPAGYTARAPSSAVDCRDTNPSVYPGAPETCDMLDNNCNGTVDEGTMNTFYRDADNDGYGNPSSPVTACSQPGGYVTNSSDCNDSNAAIGGPSSFFRDLDGDGYGSGALMVACPGPGWVGMAGDCYDDSSDPVARDVHPGQTQFFGNSFVGGTSTAPGCTGALRLCFDYNCDNANTVEPTSICSAGSTCGVLRPCSSGPQSTSGGCGSTTNYVNCAPCSGGLCGGPTSTTPNYSVACH